MATPIFDSNLFYRITNAALGQSFSLDVLNPLGGPNGEVNITPTGPFSGQLWQILSNSSSSNGEFYISNAFTGARMKLDLSVANAIYTPFLKNITTTYDQTWLISQVNSDTYSLAPSFLGGSQALTVSNDTRQPFLADMGRSNQQWQLTPLAKINDASFSLSALFPTSTAIIVSSQAFTTAPATASTTQTSLSMGATALSSSSPVSSSTLHGATLAAIIVAPVSLVAILLIISLVAITWHRKSKRRQQECPRKNRKISPPSIQGFELESPEEERRFSFPRPLRRNPSQVESSYNNESTLYPESSTYPESTTRSLHPLSARPPSRTRESRRRGGFVRPYSHTPKISEHSPIKLVEPAELPGSSPPESPVVTDTMFDYSSPAPSSIPFEGDEQDLTLLSPPKTFRRTQSLISRWEI